jgi:hypothetical protein
MKKLLLILTIGALFSCSPQKRLQRLIKNNPELITQDTLQVKIQDTIIIERYIHDTISQFFYNDTIKIIDNSKVVVRYYVDSVTKIIYADAEVKQDTIFYETEVPVIVEKVVIKELTLWEKHSIWIIPVIILMLIAIIFQLIKKFLPL